MTDLTTEEAAILLGITSPTVVQKWLQGGHFPGAYQLPNGEWWFPLSEVLECKAWCDDIRERNRTGDLALRDSDLDLDDSEWPLL